MSSSPRSRAAGARLAAILGGGALLATGCSVESLLETALSRADGVEGFEIDQEAGSFSIRTDDGEELTFDAEDGSGRIVMEDGTMTTAQTNEIPAAVAARVSLPASFEPAQVLEMEMDGQDGDDGRMTTVTGTVTGDFDTLLAELEAAAAASGDGEVMVQTMAPGVMAMVIAEHAENDGVMLSLTMDSEGATEGMLQVMVSG
ncbi:MAG: hypothetical protein JJT89_04670 [Nitriliruptoraceae bacterium]|nr:hypothetical protein [Nitriliruptoraceae bacterium]